MTRTSGTSKFRRQQAIVTLVDQRHLESQERIREELVALGITATQSTISRDIEELGLARVRDKDGTRYVVPGEDAGASPSLASLRRLLDEFVISFVRADHGLLVRTPPGAAPALAEGIDRAGLSGVAGTIAGDNTILILGQEGVRPVDVQRLLSEIMEGI
jgi:transcriptional regulator of arginine metabolism